MFERPMDVAFPGLRRPGRVVAPTTDARRPAAEKAASRTATRVLPRNDLFAISGILLLTAIIAWQRLWFWNGLAYLDVSTFYLPWYAQLGEHLRHFDIPGWNPYQFSGTPFAADPQSGWMYLPAMICFTVLPPIAAYKTFLIVHLLIAGLATYAFARVLGLGVLASLVAASAFEFGPLSSHLSCCLVHVQMAIWIPVAMLGIELTQRATTRRTWFLACALVGFAISQILAGWVGQGAMNGLLVIGSYLAYRTLLSPLVPTVLKPRMRRFAADGAMSFGLGFAVSAAGLLPRLDTIRATNLAGGDYDWDGVERVAKTWRMPVLVDRLFTGDNGDKTSLFYLGAITLALSAVAVVLARRRFAVPYFVALSVVVPFLTTPETWLQRVFYLIPSFQTLNEHVPSRVLSAGWIGPAMLAGAGVEAIIRQASQRRMVAAAFAPLVLWAWVVLELRGSGRTLDRSTVLFVSIVYLCLIALALMRHPQFRVPIRIQARAPMIAGGLLLALLLWNQAGASFVGAVVQGNRDEVVALPTGPVTTTTIAVNVASTDPGGAGEFLQQVAASGEYVRFFGYDPTVTQSGNGYPNTYREWYWDGNVQSILVNARAMRLHLYDVQGYNPVQQTDYVNYLTALNGQGQEYHDAQILPGGVTSPMLNLLNARYIVIPNDVPAGRPRPDLLALASQHKEVFRNGSVRILENDDALPRAWTVHQSQVADSGEQLSLLSNNLVDPRTTVLLDPTVKLPALAAPAAGATDAVAVTGYETDSMTLSASMTADGVVIVSETYAPGWEAYVDGKRTSMYRADGTLRAVAVAAGNHTIDLRYQPRSLQLGVWITALALLSVLAVVFSFAWSRMPVRAAAPMSAPSRQALQTWPGHGD